MNNRRSTYTILTEGSSRTNGNNKKPTSPKPMVKPAGQGTSPQNGKVTVVTGQEKK